MSQPPYASFTATPLTRRIGAEISGIDITRPLTPAQRDDVERALLDYQVIFFRDQPFDLASQKAFGRLFGELHVHPGAPGPQEHPEILRIHADEKSTYVAGEGWHSDVSCDAEPPLGSILHLHTVPPGGGDTLWASMYAAYDALSDRFKALLEGLTATHDGEHVYRGRYRSLGTDDAGRTYPRASHPVVRTHPATGRKALFVNPGFTTRIDGLPRGESDAILAFLYTHSQKPDFQVRFHWQPDSVAFWDNRCTQHLAIWDYYPEVRSGHRVTIQGDKPF
ncbi:MAG: TauD/TfdA family dioxygenase [Xenophilus sp.]